MNRPSAQPYRLLRVIVAALALVAAFAYGVGVGVYHWPPYSLLQNLKQSSNGAQSLDPATGSPSDQLLRLAFEDELIKGDQILPPIESLDGIHDAVESMLTDTSQFWGAYDEMVVSEFVFEDLNQNATQLLHMEYSLGAKKYDAYAYCLFKNNRASDTLSGRRSAALIIPGSGENQSSKIYRGDAHNYQQNIVGAFDESVDRYIFIKPNQDCFAIHNGKKKLGRDFYANWLIDHGGSYGAHYVVSCIAITKALQANYDDVVLAGMSQGGEATLLCALQSSPDAAIVSSGYSLVYEKVKWSGQNQIVIPGIASQLSAEALRQRISDQPTRYLFTWGKQELATYGIDATQGVTADALKDLPNVQCISHDGGHEFPLPIIKRLLTNGRP